MHSPALLLLSALSLTPCLTLRAQDPGTTSPPAVAVKAPLTSAQIDDLLAPVALYPDALIAIILPASTFPTDIVLAARYLNSRQDSEGIESQPWDDSVKALARYPEVLKWMDENLSWTQQLGEAFVLQPAAVLSGTQRLRAAAIAAGNLKNTPEQTVIVEREVVRIEPAVQEVIYVPVYDPVMVYRPRVVTVYEPATVVSFSSGYRTGLWLSYSCDWNRNTVVYISKPYRQTVWLTHPSWVYPGRSNSHYHRDWCPDSSRLQSVQRDHDRRHDDRIVRPATNTYVQTRPGRDSGPRNPDRTADTREPGRGRRDEVAASTPSQPTSPAISSPRPGNRPDTVVSQRDPETPRNSFGGRDRNLPSPNLRNTYSGSGRNNPAAVAPVVTPSTPSSIASAPPPSTQLSLPADSSSSKRRSQDNSGTRWSGPVVSNYTPVTPSSAPAAAPLPPAASESRADRTPKLSLKSAPAYAQESRRESRAERKAQEAQQASAATVIAAPAAPAANTGTVVADNSQKKRRDRRQEP